MGPKNDLGLIKQGCLFIFTLYGLKAKLLLRQYSESLSLNAIQKAPRLGPRFPLILEQLEGCTSEIRAGGEVLS